MTRIYLPGTSSSLSELENGKLLSDTDAYEMPLASIAHAVTTGLRRLNEAASEDDLEYVAFSRAAVAAVDLLSRQAAPQPFRVVVAADVPDKFLAELNEAEDDSRVRVTGHVPAAKVAAIHVDADEAREDVAAAAAVWTKAMDGDKAALADVEAVEDHELEWYHPTELPELMQKLFGELFRGVVPG